MGKQAPAPPKFSGEAGSQTRSAGDYSPINDWVARTAPGTIGQAAGGAMGLVDSEMGAAEKQAASSREVTDAQTGQNRPDQFNAFGFGTTWETGPDGKPVQRSSFGGPMGQFAQNRMGELGSMGAFDWSQFGQMQDGSAARDQAIEAAYGQATSRLNPQWNQREEQMRAQLANQGLDPTSQAAQAASQQFGQQRNDAYGSAMNSAIMQGQAAGDSVFRNNMMSRQQSLAEALRARGMPMEELGALQGLTGQQGFMGAGRADPTQYLSAAALQGNMDLARWQAQQKADADMYNGLFSLGTGFF
jgi:hypothetical protein